MTTLTTLTTKPQRPASPLKADWSLTSPETQVFVGDCRKVLASLATIKSGDILLPLIDGRELRLRRVSRPDAAQAELLTRLGLDLPEKLGADSVNGPDVVQT